MHKDLNSKDKYESGELRDKLRLIDTMYALQHCLLQVALDSLYFSFFSTKGKKVAKAFSAELQIFPRNGEALFLNAVRICSPRLRART